MPYNVYGPTRHPVVSSENPFSPHWQGADLALAEELDTSIADWVPQLWQQEEPINHGRCKKCSVLLSARTWSQKGCVSEVGRRSANCSQKRTPKQSSISGEKWLVMKQKRPTSGESAFAETWLNSPPYPMVAAVSSVYLLLMSFCILSSDKTVGVVDSGTTPTHPSESLQASRSYAALNRPDKLQDNSPTQALRNYGPREP